MAFLRPSPLPTRADGQPHSGPGVKGHIHRACGWQDTRTETLPLAGAVILTWPVLISWAKFRSQAPAWG